jgi:hypothetical protein
VTVPVISATHTIGDGLVVRWRHTTEGEAVVSASRNGVMIHGSVFVSDELKQWIADAEHARELIRAGREDEAKALATHKYDRPFFGDLVPIAGGDR